jgi:hypothetical protein
MFKSHPEPFSLGVNNGCLVLLSFSGAVSLIFSIAKLKYKHLLISKQRSTKRRRKDATSAHLGRVMHGAAVFSLSSMKKAYTKTPNRHSERSVAASAEQVAGLPFVWKSLLLYLIRKKGKSIKKKAAS